jgi:hypothetical protein
MQTHHGANPECSVTCDRVRCQQQTTTQDAHHTPHTPTFIQVEEEHECIVHVVVQLLLPLQVIVASLETVEHEMKDASR